MSSVRGETACPQCKWEHAVEVYESVGKHDIICYRCGFSRHDHRGYGVARYTDTSSGIGTAAPLEKWEVAPTKERLEALIAQGKVRDVWLTEVQPDGRITALIGEVPEILEG